MTPLRGRAAAQVRAGARVLGSIRDAAHLKPRGESVILRRLGCPLWIAERRALHPRRAAV